ncbi:Pyrethroid hydrolase-like protein [Emericellopsis cladophorae]|uniref:Carboxylic ester hydrolase n=1 Tax=Emericellopsis cladophorae TaxID=2686198 RepID=A0A9Q0BDR7_9HYPO|nr:Pyrethroid hydrolase-like protein [Emericellopsis cladophorae]KAI6781657.1 Pyrethroid hydrolase-like protein [Emericellopsis cladophorae]
MNVMAPTNATCSSNLPVFLYIQGGGFNSNSNPNINGTGIIDAADRDLVVVTINYRVGPYGFLTNKDQVTPNNGLRDQVKALEWVQTHISKFGGNPNHVVVGGTSAGAASVIFHLTANNGSDNGLFHGAISESASMAGLLTVKESQYQYNNLATRLGCTGKDSLECLRNKTALEIQEENFNIPLPGGSKPPAYQWLPVLDYDFINDYTYQSLTEGKFIKVPTIFGDDTNGGTVFTPKNASTQAESNQFILDAYPTISPEMFGEINDLYPNPNKTCPNQGCFWRQTSNTYQEIRYMCPALYANSAYAPFSKSWAYRWNVEDPAQIAQGLGVPHTSELEALIGAEYTDEEPESYTIGQKNRPATPVIQRYWTSFMRTLDPNTFRQEGAVEWTSWGKDNQARVVINTGGKTNMEDVDNGLRERCEYWYKHSMEMNL